MASEGLIQVSLASVMEDVLKQHGTRFCNTHLASRRAEEASARRHEASVWLRKALGGFAAKDLPNEPSEEEFRFGSRNVLILCNALNKVHLGTVPRVVDQPDGAALSAYQYFENVRNFLISAHEIGLPYL